MLTLSLSNESAKSTSSLGSTLKPAKVNWRFLGLLWEGFFIRFGNLPSIFSVPGWAQNTAELQGRVEDRAGHPAVSAFVIISSHDTSLLRAATTDDSGNFEFTALPVGTYSLEVKADGFPNSQTRDLRASIGQVIRIEIVLGSNDVLSSSRHATGTSVVETSNTQLGVVMGDLEVANLPLKSRDTFELLQLH